MEQKSISFFAFTKDITAFKCDECVSAFWIWMRPYHSGNFSQISRLNAYLDQNELGTELDYHIYGYQEVWNYWVLQGCYLQVDAAFAMDLMGYAFEWMLNINASLEVIPRPQYNCQGFTRNDYNITLRDIVINDKLHEYGSYIEQSANQFFEVSHFSFSNGLV